MCAVVVRADETVKRIIILVGQPCFELIVLGVKPIGKGVADFINLSIRHLYGFHIPHFDIFAFNRYCF